MDHIYAKRKPVPESAGRETAAPERGPSAAPVTSLRAAAGSGGAKPLALSDTIRAKMEHAFGMDLGSVRLYESQAVAEHGAGAVAQGDTIAFAPGKHDFTSRSGQEILGHELSHVASQRRGEVTGSGFLQNAALEARADREGALAAAGGQVYDGPVTGALSGVTADAAAAGPMQAWGKKKEPPKPGDPREFTSRKEADRYFDTKKGGAYRDWISQRSREELMALNDYTSEEDAGNYHEVNDPLRSGKNVARDSFGFKYDLSPESVERLNKQRLAMDSAISSFDLHDPLILHRGSSASLLGGLKDPKEIMERLGGRTVRDKGYMSTSVNSSDRFGGDIHYKIRVPAGKGRGAYLRPISQIPEESEFLLRRNAGFVVRNAYKRFGRFGQTIVEMDMNDSDEDENDPLKKKKEEEDATA